MALGTFFLLSLVRLPLDFYRSHILQHRFGLSNQGHWQWLKCHVLSFSLEGVFFVLATLLIYELILLSKRWWWLPASLIFSLFLILHLWLAPIFLHPLYYDFELLEDQKLERSIKALSNKAGIPIENVFVVNASKRTKRANAYLTGLGESKRIVLYDNLLAKFEAAEVMSIVAHELGHWQHEHIERGAFLAIAGLTLFLFVSSRILLWTCNRGYFGLRDPADPANLPLLLLIFTGLLLLGKPIGLHVSRQMERQADAASLELSQDAEAFINVERKLVKSNALNLKPSWITVFFYYTHPPVMERIAFAIEHQRRDST